MIIPLYSPRVKGLVGGRYGDRDAVALDLLEEVGFERDSFVAYKPAGALPQGYLKRLELAKAIALQPDLMILDELFSGLSLAEVASIVPIIEKMRIQGKTIIMIEHRLRELFRIADRVIVLNYGRRSPTAPPTRSWRTMRSKGLSGQRRMKETDAMLEAENLMVFFENALALNDFSMQVKPGEIIGVIGSNSAGKTTLMNTLSGLIIDMRIKEKRKGGERITVYGRILYKGKDISECPPERAGEEGHRAFPGATPRFPGKQRCGKPADRRISAKKRRSRRGHEIRLSPLSDPGQACASEKPGF